MRLSYIKHSNIYLALILLFGMSIYLTFVKVDRLKYSIFERSGLNTIFSRHNTEVMATDGDSGFVYPIAGFTKRILLKPFGIYVDPNNSSVKPERFTGFHSGVDLEYDDAKKLVPVYAICSGTVSQASALPGVGGNIVLDVKVNEADLAVIYSHLKLTSLLEVGKDVKKGDVIGYLGESGTSDSAGERKHLHFAICKNQTITYREYLPTETELTDWVDPKVFFDSVKQTY